MKPINNSTSGSIFRWQPAAWLRVNGEDAATFLQGQFTNELRGQPAAGAVYGLWLTVKGKVLADSFVLRGENENEFWLGSYFSPAAVIRERLESYIIADDVVIEDQTNAWSGVTWWGDAGASKPPTGYAFHGRRGREVAIEWVYPRSAADAMEAVLAGTRELAVEEMMRRRIEANIPAVPVDVGPMDLPNEGVLEVDAISFTKGCYLGQEVMARLKSMGQVRRRLLRVCGSNTAIPALPTPVFVEARQVGELRSAVCVENKIVGLAMLSLLHVKPGIALSFVPGGEPRLELAD